MNLTFNCNLFISGYGLNTNFGPRQSFFIPTPTPPTITNYDGSAPNPTPTQPTVPPIVEEDRAEENEDEEGEGEDEEVERGQPVAPGNKWMDFDREGFPLNKPLADKFSRFLGDQVRTRIPITFNNWKDFPKKLERLAGQIWQHTQVKNLVI